MNSAASADAGAVEILSQQVVGPYATVQLKSSDPNALNAWLIANQYDIPSNVAPIIAAYVAEGFDFLALRLIPGKDVQAMRPISVTSPGAGLSLPLRMVAAGTGATVGITLWVVGDGRYEPASLKSFLISPSDLTWDFSTEQSDYDTIRTQKESALNNAAWQIESSLSISPYQIENAVMYSGPNDYDPVTESDAGAADGGPVVAQTADQVRSQDLSTLFAEGARTVRITRMRADLSQAALANDLVLQASMDQSTISNVYQTTKSIHAPVCPPYDPSTCTCGSSGSSGGVNPTLGGSGYLPHQTGTPQPNSDAAGSSSGGCAISPASAGGSDVDASIAALMGLAFAWSRSKKR